MRYKFQSLSLSPVPNPSDIKLLPSSDDGSTGEFSPSDELDQLSDAETGTTGRRSGIYSAMQQCNRTETHASFWQF